MGLGSRGLWMPCRLTIALAIPFLAAGALAPEQCSQDGDCGSDRNVLLQLPGLLVDPTGQLYSQGQMAVEKADRPTHHGQWSASHRALLKDMKLKFNTEGDLQAFLSSLALCSVALLTMVFVFCAIYRRYPLVYSDNVLKGLAPKPIPDSYFGWVGAAWNLTPEEIEETGGLDAAMFLEFVRLALRVCGTIGIPMVLILCPLHFFAGDDWVEGVPYDRLGKLGMGNIVDGERARYIYWVHAAFIWFVVYTTQTAIFEAQDNFLKKRFDWMLRMPAPRSTTVLVEGIPEGYCNDADLLTYFSKLYDDKVVNAYVVRKTSTLSSFVELYKKAEQSLAEANFQWQALGGTEDVRPTCYSSIFGGSVDKITSYQERLKKAAAAVICERARLNDPNTAKSEVYCDSGFVTFRTERDAMIALGLKVRADEDSFVMSTPPDPADVQYNDLYAPPALLNVTGIVGYGCIVVLFFGFTPIILAISSIINLTSLRKSLPVVDQLVKAFPWSELLLEGVLASAALTLFMSFLPTALNLIFAYFFKLKAGRWAQHRIQIWYFWFQVIFVLLVTAVGSSLWDTMILLMNHPMIIFQLLADRLPAATHFYLNYMVMQWTIHGLNLTRYVNLFKFQALATILEEDRAKELSEPEDQDYYGIGGRSARFTLNLVIALVYCSLCPLITVVTGINFLICRVIYSYLIVFAEGRKPDLGGHFWVTQLRHVQHGLVIYIVLMVGILSNRAASVGPSVVVAPTLLYMARSYSRFHSAYEWEVMPFEEFVKGQQRKASWNKNAFRESSRTSYAQPELTEPALTAEK